MKKIIRIFALALSVLLVLACLVGCDSSDKPDNGSNSGQKIETKEIHELEILSGFTVKLENLSVTYDGQPHSLEVTGDLPEGITVEYEGNGAVEIGKHYVTAKFIKNGAAMEGKVLRAVLTVDPMSYDMSGVTFADQTVAYDGAAHKMEIAGKLPEGVTVSYLNNEGFTEVGTYLVTACFASGDKTYAPIPSITAKLTIKKGTYDMSGVSFPNASFDYDGTAKSLAVAGSVPGVSVSYVGNGKINAGTYTVTAHFTGDDEHYEAIPDMSATLEIRKAKCDDTAIDFGSQTFAYDGLAKNLAVSGDLPSYLSVRYEGNGQIEIGTYQVTAFFTSIDDNYEAPAPRVATLTIDRENIETVAVTFAQQGRPTVTRTILKGAGLAAADIPAYAIPAPGYRTFWVYAGTNDKVNFTAFNEDTAVEALTETIVYNVVYNADPASIPAGAVTSFTVEDLPIALTTVPSRISAFAWYQDEALKQPLLTITEIGNYSLWLGEKDETVGLIYEQISGALKLVGYNGTAPTVFIPAESNGMKVVAIAADAFRGREDIEFVSIGKNVTEIGSNAFDGCTSLDDVVLHTNLKLIGNAAFRATALKSVNIPKTVVAIGSAAFEKVELESIVLPFIGGSASSSNAFLAYIFGGNSLGANKFFVPSTLKYVELSDACKAIPADAFRGCASIEKIVLGESVTSIGINAFANCTALKEIYIPETCESIPANAGAAASPFYGCSADLVVVFGGDTDSFGEFALALNAANDPATHLVNITRTNYLTLGVEELMKSDADDCTAAYIAIGGTAIASFDSETLAYSADTTMEAGYPVITAAPNSSIAVMEITQATKNNGGVATVKITASSGAEKVYTVTFGVSGSFTTSGNITLKNGATSTLTFSFDDGIYDTAVFVKSLLADHPRLRATFALISDRFGLIESKSGDEYVYSDVTGTINQWKQLFSEANGAFDVSSHAEVAKQFWTGDLLTDDAAYDAKTKQFLGGAQQVLQDIFGMRVCAFIDTGIGVDQSKYHDVMMDYVDDYYLGMRTTNKNIVNTPQYFATPANRYAIGSYMVEHTENVSAWKQYVDNSFSGKSWAVFCIHWVIPDGETSSMHYIHESQLEELVSYVDNTYGEKIWIANFEEAMLYYFELSTASVQVTNDSDNSITIKLTDGEAQTEDIYDQPLTVKVSVPGTWNSVSYVLGGKKVTAPVKTEGASRFAYVEVVPDHDAEGLVVTCGD